MGEYVFPLFHIPDDRFTKMILNPFMNTRKMYDGLHALNISQSFFIQDFYCPIEKTVAFLEESEKKLNIFPVWLCPMKPATSPQKLSPSFIDSELLIDVGIWGRTKEFLADSIGLNTYFENFAKKIKARKMLYAHAYYTEEEFWTIYDKEWYEKLRKKYNADKIFPDIWQKTHVRNEKYKTHYWRGIFQIIRESLRGKHMNNVESV